MYEFDGSFHQNQFEDFVIASNIVIANDFVEFTSSSISLVNFREFLSFTYKFVAFGFILRR